MPDPRFYKHDFMDRKTGKVNTPKYCHLKIDGTTLKTRHGIDIERSKWFPGIDLLTTILTRDNNGKRCWDLKGGFASTEDFRLFALAHCPKNQRGNISPDCVDPFLFHCRIIGDFASHPGVYIELLYNRNDLAKNGIDVKEFMRPTVDAN